MSFGWAHSPAGSASRQPRPLCLPGMGVAIAPFCDFALKPNALLVEEPEGEEGTRREARRYQALGSCQLTVIFSSLHFSSPPRGRPLWILSPSHPCSNWLFEQLVTPESRPPASWMFGSCFFFRPSTLISTSQLPTSNTAEVAIDTPLAFGWRRPGPRQRHQRQPRRRGDIGV